MTASPDPSNIQPNSGDANARSTWKIRLADAVIAAVIVLVGGIAAYGADWMNFHRPSSEAERASTKATTATAATTSQPQSAPEAVKITITPPNGPVPRCATVRGTVTAPNDVTVWLAVHGLGDTDYYGLTPVTRDQSQSGQWEAKMELGSEDDKDKEFVVYAFPLHDEAARLLKELHIPGYYFLRRLPVEGDVPSQGFRRDIRDIGECK